MAVQPGAPKRQIGRAMVMQQDGAERWIVPDETAHQWLQWLGTLGIGGFTDTGIARPPTLERTLGPRLCDAPPDAPMPWKQACDIVVSLARGLHACEERRIRAGPVEPETLCWRDATERDTLILAHSAAVLRLVDANPRWPTTKGRWRPPETPAGKASSSAERYALGRLLYRLLAAGEPFSGSGQHRSREQEATPMNPEVAQSLPYGLQSFVLECIHSRPRSRPTSLGQMIARLEKIAGIAAQIDDAPAKAIAPASTQFVGPAQLASLAIGEQAHSHHQAPSTGGHASRISTGSGAVMAAPTPAAATPKPRRVPAWLGAGLAIAIAAPVAWLAGGALRTTETSTPSLRPAEALPASQTLPTDCASCHTRQAMEWRRSIMGQAAISPLFQSLEMLIEEQVGRSDRCPNGAGVLRFVDLQTACTVEGTGRPITGAGGEGWCINCHSPLTNLGDQVAPWDATSERSDRRQPLKSMLSEPAKHGIDCAFCHQVTRGVANDDLAAGQYLGNANWRSFLADKTFDMRPEAPKTPGIANSAYHLAGDAFVADEASERGIPHATTPKEVKEYRKSSEFCGTCHDVRLFGSDSIGIEKGEHFKRLRNAYTEWSVWSAQREAQGEPVYSCQDCHMSTFPGVCVSDDNGKPGPDPGDTALVRACPDGTHFEPREPGRYPEGAIANRSDLGPIVSHYFSSVDVPLAPEFPDHLVHEEGVDVEGTPLGLAGRRDLLLGVTFRFEIEPPKKTADGLEIPIVMENIGAGHRVPAGFSQEREIWVHLRVTDAKGKLVYEVGRVDADDEDLHDKIFETVTVRDDRKDEFGQPLGVFGADVVDGHDHPQWDPNPELGGTEFRGKGLINLQNGFLRCVKCRGTIAEDGHCEPALFQTGHRAARYDDGDYDIDTGECRSNLEGHHKFLEVFFPVGSLDAERGVVRGPDAIIDTRSLPSKTPVRYTFELDVKPEQRGPYTIEARLLFRGFPPFLLKAFAEYEKYMTEQGARPDGPLLTEKELERLEVVELHRRTVTLP